MLEVATDPAHEPDVRIGIDEELHLEARAQPFVREVEGILVLVGEIDWWAVRPCVT